LRHDGSISVTNVPSKREARQITLDVPGIGPVCGDVAWGGNWFFLVENHGLELRLENVEALTRTAWSIRKVLNATTFPLVDHIELVGPPTVDGAHARNFVLCPGKAYDRSPCGTGTSAKIACLAACGKLHPGEAWVQESIIGSTFSGTFEWLDKATGTVIPVITGKAHVNAEITQILDEGDPFCWGITS
jgi:proline racemase